MIYVKIINTDSSNSHKWGGIDFDASEELIIDNESDLALFIRDTVFFTAVGDGTATVNNGVSTYSNSVSAWSYLTGHCVENLDSRPVVHSTPRFLGTYTYFTSSDDDHTDPHAVGGSSNVTELKWEHEIDDDTTQSIYLDFNTINNRTYVRQGDLMWKDAALDRLSFKMVPKTTDYTSGSSTNYNLYGGYLIIPAAGDGIVTVADNDRVLVQNAPNEYGDMPVGYWDATWNTTTKEFDDITPNYTGEGEYNMFGTEVVLFVFMNRRLLLGTGRKDCETEDVSQLGHGIRMRIDVETVGDDHVWSGCATMMLYRNKTC